MHVPAGYFDHADQLGTSISIYHINLNEFEQRIKKLVLHVFVCKISNARARACMHFQKKIYYRSKHLQMLDYHPGKFHVDPFSSFREEVGGGGGGRNRVKQYVPKTWFREHSNKKKS
jgi:hypothetical protein